MKVTPTAIEGVLILEPKVFGDERGFFMESFNQKVFDEAVGYHVDFVQDNHSRSGKGVLRGLHYQLTPHAQGKLVRVAGGTVFDVAVDIRRASPTFGRWVGVELSADNGRQLFVPTGYAHAFLTLEPDCMVAYKVDAFYSAECDTGIIWNDPEIAIAWPLDATPQLSAKDAALPSLSALDSDFDYDGEPLGELRQIET